MRQDGIRQPGRIEEHLLDEVDELLGQWAAGDRTTEERLFEVLQPELRTIAAACRRRRAKATLQTTELIQELYLKLAGPRGNAWENRSHFLALAVRAMRQILVDAARQRGRDKRGGGWVRLSLDEVPNVAEAETSSWLVLDQALTRLGRIDPSALQVVELRFFAGLSGEECAELQGVSRRTVNRR